MRTPLRRVVTGHDPRGKAVVLIDGPAPNVKQRQASGLTSTVVWITDECPADISGTTDRAAREIGVPPPVSGSIFRVVDFPPLSADKTYDHTAVLEEMGIHEHPSNHAKSPFMHRTRSVDYVIVMAGAIDMLLDDSVVRLNAGDVLVQQGTIHAWENHGRQTCRIAFVLIDAREPDRN
jgi:naringenin degradation protein FdeH